MMAENTRVLDYTKIIKDAIVNRCKQVSPKAYATAAALVKGPNWDAVIDCYRRLILKSMGPNGAVGRLSYRELKGQFPKFAMKSGMGLVKGNADTYHGIVYRLVTEGHGITLHKIASMKNNTFWLIIQ